MAPFNRIVYLAFFAFPLFAGCNVPPQFLPATTPIESISYKNSVDDEKCCLLVLLPGIKSRAGDFEAEGFIKSVHDAGLAVDIVAVGAHLSYYMKRNIVRRLKEDIIGPAKAQGYKQVWLVGMSMGGMGALFYTKEYPQDVAGLLLIAPYLGEEDLISEISKSDGLLKWESPKVDKDDYQRELWQWLKTYLSKPANSKRFYLAYGHNDKFASTHGLINEVLPPEQVFVNNGSHNWSAWKPLWRRFLEEAAFR